MRFNADPLTGYLAAYSPDPVECSWLKNLGPVASVPFQDSEAYTFKATEPVLSELWWKGFDFRQIAPFYQWKQRPLIEGKYQPYPEQLDIAAFLTLHNKAYVTSTMRTGKTGGVVLALEYKRLTSDPGVTLVVCPVTVMELVWAKTLRGMSKAQVAILRGSRADRLRQLGEGNPTKYLVINYDGLEVIRDELTATIKRGEITKVVIDEMTAYGNTQTKRWKTANAMFNGMTQVPTIWGLTGTPGADPEAVYGYAKLVNPGQMSYKSLTAWRNAVYYYWGSEPWQRGVRSGAEDLIKRTLQPNIRFVKEEVLPDLPGVSVEHLYVELTSDQREAYELLKVTGRALVEQAKVIKVIKADQKAIILQKLFQISLGHVRADNGQVAVLNAQPRLDMLEKLIKSSANKTVIFGAYINVNEAVTKHLRNRGISAAKVDGTVTGKARDKIFHDFQNNKEPHVLVVHPITTAYGTELSRADKIIFNGPMLSGLHVYLQAIERLSSQKQRASIIKIYNLFGTKEEEIFQSKMNGKASWANCVADSFKQFIL
jgi:SNF2 family DNA or RNA helicase